MELKHIVEAKHLFDHTLLLTFDDGAVKVFDFGPELWGEMMEPLKNVEYFKNFSINYGTICWPNDMDFCPDSLYESATSIEQVLRAWKGAA